MKIRAINARDHARALQEAGRWLTKTLSPKKCELARPWTREEAQRLVLGIRAWDLGNPAPPAAAESQGSTKEAKDLADQIQKAVGALGPKALAALSCFAFNHRDRTGKWHSTSDYRAVLKALDKLVIPLPKTEPPSNKREIPH